MAEPVVTQLDRLATRIVAGDVVFFVGAGYSIDSERNTAGVFVARLVARFEAITDAVTSSPADKDTPLGQLCADLKDGLRRTFSLDTGSADDIWSATEKNITKLAESYYQINDWMCSAFESLLAHADALDRLATEIHDRENALLAGYHQIDRVGHSLPLQRMSFRRFADLLDGGGPEAERAPAGKAMFLETMGFEDPSVMAGNFLSTPEYVSGTYVGRLRPRHFALAWMAHERWLPVVVTTNYDLLLEGAFCLAGLEPQVAAENMDDRLDPRAPVPMKPRWNARFRNFAPISDATQFFSYGDGYESALLLKIHGCVYRYRYESRTPSGWRDVLPTMVFTFREIQNWRDDSWSRDFLQTLMRTRTVAFAGYSTADPVLHDTFRSVYEEMARYRVRRYRLQLGPQGKPISAPDDQTGNAFYFGVAGKREFHALEVLRAASAAVGARTNDITSHRNLIGFHFESGGDFPKLDEVMLWTFHLAYRKVQRQALGRELCRVYYQLFGKPCPDSEAAAIVSAFERVVSDERDRAELLETQATCARRVKDGPRSIECDAARRAELQRSVGWTAHFHRNLMREYEAADLLVRDPARGSRVHSAMRWPWYAALGDHPDWGAWAVVLELALRCRSRAWAQACGDWRCAAPWIEPVPADRAAVMLPHAPGDTRAAAPRICLSVEVPELRLLARGGEPARALHLLPLIVLSLHGHGIPWRRQNDDRDTRIEDPGRRAPKPDAIWKWALGEAGPPATRDSQAHMFFGGTDVRPFGRTATRRV